MRVERIKEQLKEDTKDDKTIPYYYGVEITKENFDFDDLLRMLTTQEKVYKQQIEGWKFCVEMSRVDLLKGVEQSGLA